MRTRQHTARRKVERTATIAGIKLVSPGPGIWRIMGTETRFYGARGTHGYRWHAPHNERVYEALNPRPREATNPRRSKVSETCV